MYRKKIISLNKLVKTASALKRKNKRIIFTNGCFDILHSGHVSYLNKAKNLGNILIVGVNTDSSIKRIKGRNRPINKLRDRLEVLAGLECIDYLCTFSQMTPIELIKRIKPDILVKGADWKNKDIVGNNFIKSYGGKTKTITFKKGYSTTNLIKKINSLIINNGL